MHSRVSTGRPWKTIAQTVTLPRPETNAVANQATWARRTMNKEKELPIEHAIGYTADVDRRRVEPTSQCHTNSDTAATTTY